MGKRVIKEDQRLSSLNNGLPTDNLSSNAAKAWHSWVVFWCQSDSWGHYPLGACLVLAEAIAPLTQGLAWYLEHGALQDHIAEAVWWLGPLREFNYITLITESFLFVPYFSSEVLERNSTDETKSMHCPSAEKKKKANTGVVLEDGL